MRFRGRFFSRGEVVGFQSSLCFREGRGQLGLRRLIGRVRNRPIPELLTRIRLLGIKSLPLGSDQTIDSVVEMHMHLLDTRPLGRQSGVLSGGSRFLGRIGRLCGGRQGNEHTCDDTS